MTADREHRTDVERMCGDRNREEDVRGREPSHIERDFAGTRIAVRMCGDMRTVADMAFKDPEDGSRRQHRPQHPHPHLIPLPPSHAARSCLVFALPRL
eukprot:38564-Rhodomonas_salina.3